MPAAEAEASLRDGTGRPGGSRPSGPPASVACATPRSAMTAPRRPRRPRRGAGGEEHKAVDGARRHAVASPSRPACSRRRRTCGRAASARPRRSTASSGRSPTCSPSTPSRPADAQLHGRPPSTARRGSAAEELQSCARWRATAAPHAPSAASTSMQGAAAGSGWSTRTCSPWARCAGSRSRRRLRRQRPLRRARDRHDLGRRNHRLGDGMRRAGPDRRAVAAFRRRCRAAPRARRHRRPRGARRAARPGLARRRRVVGAARSTSLRRSRGWSSRIRAAHAADDGARAGGQRPRRRPQPLRRLRGGPVRRRWTASTAASLTSPAPSTPRTGPRSWTR